MSWAAAGGGGGGAALSMCGAADLPQTCQSYWTHRRGAGAGARGRGRRRRRGARSPRQRPRRRWRRVSSAWFLLEWGEPGRRCRQRRTRLFWAAATTSGAGCPAARRSARLHRHAAWPPQPARGSRRRPARGLPGARPAMVRAETVLAARGSPRPSAAVPRGCILAVGPFHHPRCHQLPSTSPGSVQFAHRPAHRDRLQGHTAPVYRGPITLFFLLNNQAVLNAP